MKVSVPPAFDTPALKKLFDAIPDSKACLCFVGGCVRDHLLGKASDDIDLATNYLPQEIQHFLKQANIKCVPTGIDHGTVMAVIDGQGFEITTLRRDIETDGRHAKVTFTSSFEEDAARRDFTFNALYMDQEGTVTDFHHGIEDLKQGVVKFIGTAKNRIQEDYLRILRFYRFYGRYGEQKPDSATLNALKQGALHLKNLSGERIHSELKKIFQQSDLAAVYDLMDQADIFCHLFKDRPDLNVRQKFESYQKEGLFNGTLPLARYLTLFQKIDNATIITTLKSLNPSQREVKWWQNVMNLMVKWDVDPLEIHLHHHPADQVYYAYLLKQAAAMESLNTAIISKISSWQQKDFPLTGADLMKEGFKPGPDLGAELKKRERQWVLQGRK